MSAFEAFSIWIIDHHDAAAERDLFLLFLSEQSLAREAVYDGDARLLRALGAGEACDHGANARACFAIVEGTIFPTRKSSRSF